MNQLFRRINCQQCSKEGGLNIDQLRLATFSLVKGVSSLSDGTSLAWYCVENLWSEIDRLRTSGVDPERFFRMGVTFVSILPCFPIQKILPWYLQRLESLVEYAKGEQKDKFIAAIHEEILRRVGDSSRGSILRWWYDTFNQNKTEQPVLQVLTQRAAL